MLVRETVGTPGEGDADFDQVQVSGSKIHECHWGKLAARE
ncbi:hypothetical protein Q0Z83_089680 [Actinoplanes sichuanensis]|nr:hypothetical protein Q0Z83_089680 [Actinoplanes sichuanensis]